MNYRKAFNILLASVFAVSFSAFLSLGFTCFVQLLGVFFSANDYPRLVPFCLIVGMLALFAVLVILSLNAWAAMRLEFTVSSWMVEVIGIGFLPCPMLIIWQIVFHFLRTTF